MRKNTWFNRGVFTIALATLLLPFPSLAVSLGSVPTPVVLAETLDIGPHVSVVGMALTMEKHGYYYITLGAWNGGHSGGSVIVGASVWFEIQNAGSGVNVVLSGNMITDDHGLAKFTQNIFFGPGGFRIRAWMEYGGNYYAQHEWTYFNVYENIVVPGPGGNSNCPTKIPSGWLECK